MDPQMMKAAQLHAPGDLRVETVAKPSPGTGQVLLEVEACGVCGSDIPRICVTGTYHFPTIPGHEFAGRVVEAGPGVDAKYLGRRSAVIPLIGCGVCEMCRTGLPFHCASYDFLGSRSDGGFAEYVLAPASNLVFLGENVSGEAAALLEPMAVGLHCMRRPGVEPGDTVVVFGAGGIGLFAAQWARLLGAGRVIQVDIRERALESARACGADTIIDASSEKAVEKVMELTSGRGADLAVEAAGSPISTAEAFRCVRRRGRISFVGRIDGAWTMPEDVLTGLMRKEQTLYGNWGFDSYSFPANDWEVAAQALSAEKIVVEPIISHRFALDEANEAVRIMRDKAEHFCKVMLVMDGRR